MSGLSNSGRRTVKGLVTVIKSKQEVPELWNWMFGFAETDIYLEMM